MLTMEQAGVTAATLYQSLCVVAQTLYSRGFDVIGSQGKMPNLHKWKGIDRAQLLQWALANFQTGKANSLTLRLDGTEICALDCDFPSKQFTDDFIRRINRADLIPQLFTTSGKKGCKIFFRTDLTLKKSLPLHLGPSVICLDGRKFDLEIKKDLSVIFGAYPEPNSLYSAYEDTDFIANCTIYDLPYLNKDQIERIKSAYLNTIAEHHLEGALTFDYGLDGYVQKIKASIAYDLLQNRSRLYSFLIDVGDELIIRALSDFYDPQSRRLPNNPQSVPLVNAVNEMRETAKNQTILKMYVNSFERIYEAYKIQLMGALAQEGVSSTLNDSVLDLYEKYYINRRYQQMIKEIDNAKA